MADVLNDQRTATRFRILVEIADRQPAVSQGEIAEAVGVTSQAVSEYVRELIDDGLVRKESRSRYRMTTEGVDWLLNEAGEMRRYLEYVTGDVLGSVREDAAIATAEIHAEDPVSLSLQDGLLHATPGTAGTATGTATMTATEGEDVGVTEFNGIIDLEPGVVTIVQIPTISTGGSHGIDPERISDRGQDYDIVLAAGVEGVVATRQAGIEPDMTFAVGDIAADAAGRGVDVLIVATAGMVGRITDPLADADLAYELETLE